ncbi:unnamed protein product [Ectocarpus sp. 6 AP-2014]
MSHPQVAEVAMKRLPATADDDVQSFNEQFFPQHTKSTGHAVHKTSWMRAIEASQNAPPKSERETPHPSEEHDRDDTRGSVIPAVLRQREAQQAAQTISKFKKFESPVQAEWTANGENRGLHPIKRYHKFLLSDQPVLEIPGAPRGNFASGADKSSLPPQLDNTRRELHVQHTGVPAASFRVGIPDASFDLEASNAENWEIDAHVAAASRAPVDSGSNTALINRSFSLAHDEGIDTLAVADRAGLSKSLPRSDIDTSVNTALHVQSVTPAHDDSLDLFSVREKANVARTNLPSSAEQSNCNSALIKASFELSHDGGIDTQAVIQNCGRSKTHLPPSEPPPVADMLAVDRGLSTPSVVGATSGVRKKHTDKSGEFQSVSKKEDLSASAQQVSLASGKRASKPSAASRKAEHEHADGKFAEEETSSAVRGAPHTRKAADISRFNATTGDVNQFSLGNSKDAINRVPFTSSNHLAPQATTLPKKLAVAPTASVALSKKEVTLKASDQGLADMFSMGRNKQVANVKTFNLSEKEPDQQDRPLRTIVLDRTNKCRVVGNPYSRPRPTITR